MLLQVFIATFVLFQYQIPDTCIVAAKALWNSSVPLPVSAILDENAISEFSKALEERSERNAT